MMPTRANKTPTNRQNADPHDANASATVPFRRARIRFLVTVMSALLAPGFALGQDSGGEEAGNEADDPSRETDISEDNYRRFMELDDRRLERPAFPAAALQPGSRLQKMGQLPESSQKHLRNQLRGIILARGDWTPEEIGRDYPFVPSAEAREDAQLLRDEIEAWAELVTEYHEREAAVYAAGPGAPGGPAGSDEGTAQQQAGGAPGSPTGENPGGEAGDGQASGTASGEEGQPGGAQGGQEGQGENTDGGAAERVADESPEERRPPIDPASQDSAAPPSREMSTEGVVQSASAYLQARGYDTLPETVERTPEDVDTRPGAADAGRWGEASQTLPPPLREATPASPAIADDDPGAPTATPAPNTLTLDELRSVRGVNEPVEVGTPFESMSTTVRVGEDDDADDAETAGGEGSTVEPEPEPDPDSEPGADPDTAR